MSDPTVPTGDRRPIAAREWSVFQCMARRLADRGVAPNTISTFSMVFGVSAGAALAATSWAGDWARLFWLLAAGGIQLRLLANMLDGMVAIAAGKTSPLGELFNEAPDRVSDAAILIGLGYAAGGQPALGYLAAIVAILTAYVRALGKVAGAPQEFCGPMAKQQRMFTITVLALFCGLTPAAWQPLWGEPPAWGLAAITLGIIIAGSVATIMRRLSRIAAHLRKAVP
jgi:phosphatidylglycerophosphate synthase